MADETIKIDIIGNADNYSKSVKKAALVTKELEDAKKRLLGESGNLSNVLSAGGYALGAFTAAATATAAAVALMAKGQVEASRQINKLSGSSALAKDTIAGLRIAALQAGIAVEDLVPIDFADKLEELRAGSASFVEDFALIGLAAKDFQGLSVDESFRLFTERLLAAKDESKQTAAATRILSTAGENLLAVYKGNNASLEDNIRLGKLVGAGAKENEAAINGLTDAYGKLAIGYEAVSGGATRALAAITPFTTFTGSLASDVSAASNAVGLFVGQLESVNKLLAGDWQGFWDAEPVTATWKAGAALRLELNGVAEQGREFRAAMEGTREALNRQLYTLKEIGGELEDATKPVRMQVDVAAKKAEDEAKWAKRKADDDAKAAKDAKEAIDLAERGAATAARWKQQYVAGRDAAIEAEKDLARAQQERVDAEMAAYEMRDAAAKQKAKDDQERFVSGVQTQLAMIESTSAAWVDILKDGTEQQKKVARVIFGIQKAAAVAQAGVNTALAISQALGSAPPPYNFILAGIAGAAGAAAAVAVAASPAPSFHIGTRAGDLAPDETTARVTRRETVLTPQGVAQLNAGRNKGNADGDGPMYVILMDHEVVGLAAARSVRRPGSALHRAMAKDLPGHSRRRIT